MSGNYESPIILWNGYIKRKCFEILRAQLRLSLASLPVANTVAPCAGYDNYGYDAMSGVENTGGGFLESSNYDNQGGNHSQGNKVGNHICILTHCLSLFIPVSDCAIHSCRQKQASRLCDLLLSSRCSTLSNHTENQSLRLIMSMLPR